MLFQEFKNEDAQYDYENTKKMKEKLMSILSHQKAMALMLLSVLSFIVSTYFMVQLIQVYSIIDIGEGSQAIQFNIDAIFYIGIIMNAILPMFYIAVYFYAKKRDEAKLSSWFDYGKIYMQINLILTCILGAFAILPIVGVLFFNPFLGLLLFIFIIGLFGIMIWLTIAVIQFLKAIRDNLSCEKIDVKADPSRVIIYAWLILIFSVFSLTNGLINPTNYPGANLQDMVTLLNQLTLYSGSLGILTTVSLMLVLYQIKYQYTEPK